MRLNDFLRTVGKQIKTPNFLISRVLDRLQPYDIGFPLLRVGPAGDGGYLLPDIDLSRLQAAFSPGVASECGFERELSERFNVPAIMVDGSVEAPVNLPHDAIFEKVWLGRKTSVNSIGLKDLVVKYVGNDNRKLLLQMDIEGAEYKIIPFVSMKTVKRFEIIVIELHYLHRMSYLVKFLTEFFPTIMKLTSSHQVIHVHANNCCGQVTFGSRSSPEVIEVTLLRRDLFTEIGIKANLPHSLDRDCVPEKASISAAIMWEVESE